MCEETPAVVYCVGYVLPVACCVAGACMSCYGCYRYYRAGELRRRRLERLQREIANIPEVFPRLKRDTLKRKMTKAFTKSISNTNKEKDLVLSDLNEQVLKDMRDACPICMDSYDEDSKTIFIGLIKNCGHYFHFECLWNWLELNQSCPICREGCDLAESDLKGLSLEQVLKMAPMEISKLASEHSSVANFRDCESQTSMSSNEYVSCSNTLNRSVTVATVITCQPRTPGKRTSSLVEQMKQRFEGFEGRHSGIDINAEINYDGASEENGAYSNPSYE